MADLVKTYPLFNVAQFGYKKEVVCVYDFAVDGGTFGTGIVLCKLPNNTVITGVIFDVITAPVGVGATLSLGANTGIDLLNACAIATFAITDLVAGIPVGVILSTTDTTAVKLTADRDITFLINTANLTAGKLAIHIEYFEGGE